MNDLEDFFDEDEEFKYIEPYENYMDTCGHPGKNGCGWCAACEELELYQVQTPRREWK